MRADRLAVWLDGYPLPAGQLVRSEEGGASFQYDGAYIEALGLPLSLALPLQEQKFNDVRTRAFFANLLPENNQLQRVMEREGLELTDVVGLLYHLGADCPGAISCLPPGDPPVKAPGLLDQDYEPIEERELARIVRSLADTRRLPSEVRDPSPVAGVQSKIALTLLPDGTFSLPRPGVRVPTTHILKVPERRHGREARLEEASALLADALDLNVSVPVAMKFDGVDALLIERFDRHIENGVVSRIHQEDFAQALGFPSELKYQRNGKPGRWFDADAAIWVLNQTADPDAARLEFLLATLFNLCIGNTDNHAKNHALLYSEGRTPFFAPLYDLLPIRIDDRYNHQLSYNIGAARFFDNMTSEDLATFIAQCGVEDISEFVDKLAGPMLEQLEAATPILRSQNQKNFDDLIGREMRRLSELLNATIDFRERDTFLTKGGGWGTVS